MRRKPQQPDQSGGPVQPGQIYLIGNGHPPELFVPLPGPQYLILRTIERTDGRGFHWPGEILSESDINPRSIVPLMESYFLMPHIPPAIIAQLPETE